MKRWSWIFNISDILSLDTGSITNSLSQCLSYFFSDTLQGDLVSENLKIAAVVEVSCPGDTFLYANQHLCSVYMCSLWPQVMWLHIVLEMNSSYIFISRSQCACTDGKTPLCSSHSLVSMAGKASWGLPGQTEHVQNLSQLLSDCFLSLFQSFTVNQWRLNRRHVTEHCVHSNTVVSQGNLLSLTWSLVSWLEVTQCSKHAANRLKTNEI